MVAPNKDGGENNDGVDNSNRATLVVAPNNVVGENNDGGDNSNRATLVVAPNKDGGENNDGVDNNNRATTRVAPTKTIGDMMDAFKSITTVEYIRGVKTLGWPRFDGTLWQRNYYEHIIRDEESYLQISNYILNNPAKWAEDKFYMQ